MAEYQYYVWHTVAQLVRRALVPLVSLLALCASCSLSAQPNDQRSIFIVTSRVSESFQRELDNFSQQLREAAPNFNIVSMTVQNVSPEFGGNTAAIVTIGSDAAQAVASSRHGTPVLHLFVTQGVIDKIYGSELPSNVFVILLEQPFQRYVDAVKTLFPKAEGVSILYGPVSVKRKLENDLILKQKGLIAKSIVIDETDNASRAIESLVDFELPIIAIPDAVALPPSNSKWLLYAAYRKRAPVIVYSHAFLIAGATAGVYSTPDQLLHQALEFTKNSLLQKENGKEQKNHPVYYDVVVNKRVAKSLSLSLPNEVKTIE
jgi:ABC-type uncharacterized transport system substrate-binding protein